MNDRQNKNLIQEGEGKNNLVLLEILNKKLFPKVIDFLLLLDKRGVINLDNLPLNGLSKDMQSEIRKCKNNRQSGKGR